MNKRKCQYEGCGLDADCMIVDSNETRPDVVATDACEEHVGPLLGSVDPTPAVGPWIVSPAPNHAASTEPPSKRWQHRQRAAQGDGQ